MPDQTREAVVSVIRRVPVAWVGGLAVFADACGDVGADTEPTCSRDAAASAGRGVCTAAGDGLREAMEWFGPPTSSILGAPPVARTK